MNSSRTTTKLAVIGISVLTLTTALQAQVIDVKIGATTANGGVNGVYLESGQAVLGTASDYWNEFPYVSSTPYNVNLYNNSDSTTTAYLTVANSTGTGVRTISGGNPGFLFNSQPYQNSGGVFTITLTGLLASQNYTFVGYATYPTTTGGSWTVTKGTLISGTTINSGASANINNGNGNAYSQFIAQTDASGNLTVTDTSLSGQSTILNGFQLQVVAVPEPSTYSLFGFGFLALLFLARRKIA